MVFTPVHTAACVSLLYRPDQALFSAEQRPPGMVTAPAAADHLPCLQLAQRGAAAKQRGGAVPAAPRVPAPAAGARAAGRGYRQGAAAGSMLLASNCRWVLWPAWIAYMLSMPVSSRALQGMQAPDVAFCLHHRHVHHSPKVPRCPAPPRATHFSWTSFVGL